MDFNVLNITPYAEFNWAYTYMVAFAFVLIPIKMLVRIISRS